MTTPTTKKHGSGAAKRLKKLEYFTTSCSGCFESVDGHNVFGFPYDAKARCHVGAGCSECGYTGKRRVYFDPVELEKEISIHDKP